MVTLGQVGNQCGDAKLSKVFFITMKYVYYLQSYNMFIISSPTHMGLLDPETSDGRIIFFLPWEQYTVAGLFIAVIGNILTLFKEGGTTEDSFLVLVEKVRRATYKTPHQKNNIIPSEFINI